MRLILFLSRVALVCNFFFVLTVLLHWKSFISEQSLVSTVVIIGYFLAVFIFTPLIHILYLMVLVLRRRLFDVVPKWLVMANFIFLLLQLIYILLFLNGTFYS